MNDTTEDRRSFTRIMFTSPANIEMDGKEVDVQLIDLSLNGALIEMKTDDAMTMGDKTKININLDNQCLISMQVEVRHVKDNKVGLHCENIDIDSITHLRRLVELNLADDSVLNRELSQLGK